MNNLTECQIQFEHQKLLLKALMRDMQCYTLFATYNPLYDEIYCFSGSGICSDAFVCHCDLCSFNVNSNE